MFVMIRVIYDPNTAGIFVASTLYNFVHIVKKIFSNLSLMIGGCGVEIKLDA